MTKNNIVQKEKTDYQERYALAADRIRTLHAELWEDGCALHSSALCGYCKKATCLLMQVLEVYDLAKTGLLRTLTENELFHLNHALYEEITGERYLTSYANPSFTVKLFGHALGTCLSTLYAELRGTIAYAFEERLFYLTVNLELFLEIYHIIEDNRDELVSGLSATHASEFDRLAEPVRQAIYYHFFDYADVMIPDRTRSLLLPEMDFAVSIIKYANLSDLRYLYFFGEYISENEYKTAEYLNTLSEEEITAMASTFTSGYRKGFETYRIGLSGKKTVNIRYHLGFERVVKKAVEQFEQMGLKPCIYRAGVSLPHRSPHGKIGFFGGSPNKQYDYDHRMDEALLFDKAYADRKLNEQRLAYETYRDAAAAYAGPACMETFGETPFEPAGCKEALTYSQKQQKIRLDYQAASSLLTNEFIPGDKVSFTIIAYPLPEIGPDYTAIFADTIRVNTLDEARYQVIQTKLIDALDRGESVTVTGRGANRTNLQIALTPLDNPKQETKFENCLADVNIPLGEVFTSPQLKGTNGTLHVTSVYLNDLHYKEFELQIEDGIITDYSCSNFEEDARNRKYIQENFLFQHKTLPMGEFAIGTNTTAYAMGRKFQISHLLPILIAEKTGPHFAFGDTCFSHEEDMKTYNPDGKEMKAKENDYSRKRGTDSRHAYFNCHTDVTVPYHELGDILVNLPDGSQIPLIQEGRFVLPGTEELNTPLSDICV